MTFFHVTRKARLENILSKGLIPSKERRGAGFEYEEGVYLFNSVEEASDGVMNWLGDEFDEDEELILLRIDVPADWEIEADPELSLSASRSVKVIPPKFISVQDENF